MSLGVGPVPGHIRLTGAPLGRGHASGLWIGGSVRIASEQAECNSFHLSRFSSLKSSRNGNAGSCATSSLGSYLAKARYERGKGSAGVFRDKVAYAAALHMECVGRDADWNFAENASTMLTREMERLATALSARIASTWTTSP